MNNIPLGCNWFRLSFNNFIGCGTSIRSQQFSISAKFLAGHAKWQNIMHTKSANDAKKQVIRAKIAQQIKVAIREGGGSTDPKLNSKLSAILEIAKNNKVPQENIQRILADKEPQKNMKLIPFALKGPLQSVLILEMETDNVNKTRQEVSTLVKKTQFAVTDLASVAFRFKHLGSIWCSERNNVPVSEAILDAAIADALSAGADDVTLLKPPDSEYDEVLEFTTDPGVSVFYPAIKALQDLNYKVVQSQLEYVAFNPVEFPEDQLGILTSIYDKISKLPNFVRLFHNIA